VVPLVEDDDALEASLKPEFAQGVDIVLDYLWGRSARTALVAAARAGNEHRSMRFVSIGSVTGPELALPSAVLRSSRIQLIGSGLGSVPIERLTASISALLTAAGAGRLTLATRAVPLAEIATAWTAPDDGRRIVVLPGAQGV
jgi:hypothetical protein